MTSNTHTDGLTALGIDIMLGVISYLDNVSVISLLEAWPSLKRYAILITDHIMPPLHFGLKGVTRRYISNPGFDIQKSQGVTLFNKYADKQPIRLIEVTMTSTVEYHLLPSYVYSVPRETSGIPLTGTTFAFLDTNTGLVDYSNQSYERFVEDRHCKCVLGGPTYPSKIFYSGEPEAMCFSAGERRDEVLGRTLSSSTPGLTSVQCLSIEISDDYFGGLTLPKVERLTVVFNSQGLERAPEFTDVTAPVLQELVVRYTNFPPRFTKPVLGGPVEGDTAYRAHRRSEPPQEYSSFELAHIPCLQFGTVSSPFDKLLNPDQRMYRGVDMSFTSRFSALNFTGVPTFLVRKCCLYRAHKVVWHVHDVYDEQSYDSDLEGGVVEGDEELWKASVSNMYVSKLRDLRVYLCCEGARFIPFNGVTATGFSMRVFVLAHNVDISGVWKSLRDVVLLSLSLHLYQDPSLELSRDSERQCLTIDQKEWAWFVDWHHQFLTSITLSGFRIPLLSVPLKPQYRPGKCPTDVWLRPFVPAGTRQVKLAAALVGRDYVGCIDAHLAQHRCLQVHPIFADESDKGQVELVLTSTRAIDTFSLKLCASVDWKSVHLEDRSVVLPQEADTDKEALERLTIGKRVIVRTWTLPLYMGYRRPGYPVYVQYPGAYPTREDVAKPENFEPIFNSEDPGTLRVWCFRKIFQLDYYIPARE